VPLLKKLGYLISSDLIGNLTHDLPAYSIVPQQITIPRAAENTNTYRSATIKKWWLINTSMRKLHFRPMTNVHFFIASLGGPSYGSHSSCVQISRGLMSTQAMNQASRHIPNSDTQEHSVATEGNILDFPPYSQQTAICYSTHPEEECTNCKVYTLMSGSDVNKNCGYKSTRRWSRLLRV
jgi:hypothetical protein